MLNGEATCDQVPMLVEKSRNCLSVYDRETACVSLTGCAEADLSRLAIVRTFRTTSEPDTRFVPDAPATGAA